MTDQEKPKTHSDIIRSILIEHRNSEPGVILDKIIEQTGCSYTVAKSQLSRIRKQIAGGVGKKTYKSRRNTSGSRRSAAAKSSDKKAGELVTSDVLDRALKKINGGYASHQISLNDEEVFALASQGTRLEDISQSCGLTSKEFRDKHGTAFDRGSAAFRVVLSATTTNIAVGDKDVKMVTALRNYEFGQGAGASHNTTNILIAGDRDGLIEKLKAVFEINQRPALPPIDGELAGEK